MSSGEEMDQSDAMADAAAAADAKIQASAERAAQQGATLIQALNQVKAAAVEDTAKDENDARERTPRRSSKTTTEQAHKPEEKPTTGKSAEKAPPGRAS